MAREVTNQGSGSTALWFGVLGGPAAWSLQVILGYGAEEIACSPGSQSEELAGMGIEPFLVVVSLALTMLTLAALLVSIRCLRIHRSGDPTTGDRAKWMAVAGVMVSVLFLIVLVSGFAPVWFLSTCTPAP
jgi:hypothetical protein